MKDEAMRDPENRSTSPEVEVGDEIADESGEFADPLMVDPFDPTQINIQPKQDTLRNLIDRLRNDEIDMNTDFQRNADLWSFGQMSKLIESILIRFPLPAFYFDASDDNNWLVVDGLQRLSSIRKFVVEKDPSQMLRLSNLDFLKDLKGKTYDALPRQYQRRIDECPVTLFLIQPGTPTAAKYSIFRRINTGGLVLNSQEIRNALARPRERKFFETLAKNENLIKTMGNQSRRMLDQELVLRFISFLTSDYIKSPKNIAEFMDDAMESIKKYSEAELRRLEEQFRRAMDFSYKIFGTSAFEKRGRLDSDRRKRKNTSLFEVWTVSIAKISDEQANRLIERKEAVNDWLQHLIDTDDAFFRSISLATQKRDHVHIRYQRVDEIIKGVCNA